MDNRKYLILVVDDVEQNVAVISQMLRANNHQVIAAFSGEGALRILEKRVPDLILLDVMMPDMDGIEVCSRIKQAAVLQDIPVIFLSALSDTDTKVRGLEVGGVDYITKPFQSQEVMARVSNQLKISRLEQDRKQHIEELERLNEEKDKLMQIVSHDLRSPLGGVYGLAEILKTGKEATNETLVREFAAIISSTSSFLLTLVNDLLDLAKVESGKMEVEYSEFSITQSINNCMQLLGIVAQNKGVELVCEPSEEEIVITADEPKIIQILNNVISNAVKFTPSGGVVTVGARYSSDKAGGRQIALSVRDTGLGIDADTLPHIFDKFGKHQRSGTAGEQGTGLGMPIVKRFVELHGGSILITSKVNLGTTIDINLPQHPTGLPV